MDAKESCLTNVTYKLQLEVEMEAMPKMSFTTKTRMGNPHLETGFGRLATVKLDKELPSV